MKNINEPLVSVITPTYNEEANIQRHLKSIRAQTYKNVEAIIVDDASEDNTVKLARKYTKNVYPRKHADRSVQRNFGFKKSKGEYLLIVDCDMELTDRVIEDCVKTIVSTKHKALIIPERTVGSNFMSRVRRFEREMYMGDPTVEVARFFDAKVFSEFGGYDENLTGAEDYDLPYRIIKKYSIGWAHEWILHHEKQLTLPKQLKKKFHYAKKSASYAQKHPELVATQGNMLFRKAYIRHWKKFVKNPLMGTIFIFIRSLEATAAVAGYISAVGLVGFGKTFLRMIAKR